MDSDQLLGILAGLPVPAVRYHEVTGSTNDDAMAWVGDGAPDGALVAANKQTRGRGRMDRQWLTPAGTALAFSLVLRPTQQEKIHLPLFSPLAALAVTDALDALGIHAEIKWPNDILIQRRKVCGILAEAIWVGAELQAVVVGIGVNMTPESIPPADSVSFPADCVELATGAPVNRWALMAGIVEAIFAWRGWLGTSYFLETWQRRLAFLQERVQILSPGGGRLDGVLVGIDREGNMLLETSPGSIRSIPAGDVHLRVE